MSPFQETKMVNLIIFLCVLLVPFSQPYMLHQRMSPDEVFEIFQTTKDAVPDYEIISLKHTMHKREAEPVVKAQFFEQKKTLYLKPTEGILAGKHTKVWTAKKGSSGKLEYTIVPNAMDDIGKFYQDEENEVAFRVKRDSHGNILFEGTIGPNHAIRPVPVRHRRDVSFLNNLNNADDAFMVSEDHIVFKIPNTTQNIDSKPSSLLLTNEKLIPRLTRSISKRSTPEIVYPEILIFVDDALFSTFGKDAKKAVTYLVTFYNGVDLRYRAIQKPKVRLNIAGIILVDGVTAFLETEVDGKYLNGFKVMNLMAAYLLNHEIFKFKTDYDVALYMTGLDLEMKDGDKYSGSLAGLALAGGACKWDSNGVNAVAFFEDNGAFNGINAGAHELAHLFEVPHDDFKDGSDECRSGAGYIMKRDSSSKNLNRSRFSPCSQEKMRNFFNSDKGECVRNPPPDDQQLPRILPGKYMSLDEQCMGITKTKYCNVGEEKVCDGLFCFHPDADKPGVCVSSTVAAEGSPCGNDKYCLNGECVPESTKTVPGVISYF